MKKLNVSIYFYLQNTTVSMIGEGCNTFGALRDAVSNAKFEKGLSGMYKIISCNEAV